jgi:uncharacterized membrane protein YhaH (DUF805 family)
MIPLVILSSSILSTNDTIYTNAITIADVVVITVITPINTTTITIRRYSDRDEMMLVIVIVAMKSDVKDC